MARHWFVTPVLWPDRRLDGPFGTYAACEAACVLRQDRERTAVQLVQGRLAVVYAPRQFEVIVEAPHYYAPPRVVQEVRARTGEKGMLPDLVYTYTRSGLLTLCAALGLPAPAPGSNRSGIIVHMEECLALLARRR